MSYLFSASWLFSDLLFAGAIFFLRLYFWQRVVLLSDLFLLLNTVVWLSKWDILILFSTIAFIVVDIVLFLDRILIAIARIHLHPDFQPINPPVIHVLNRRLCVFLLAVVDHSVAVDWVLIFLGLGRLWFSDSQGLDLAEVGENLFDMVFGDSGC